MIFFKTQKEMVGTAGFEPATDGSTVHCSARLSYVPCDSIAALVSIKGLLSSQYSAMLKGVYYITYHWRISLAEKSY